LELYAGTSGYSYKEWKGVFYPEDLSAKEMLRFYGDKLDAVEINNTFYRLPKTTVLENWASQVPSSFRFSIKASRRITHFTRMKPEAAEPTEYLLSTLETLGEQLGVVLFQLPPNLKKDVDRLAGFLEMLPQGTPAAFEFRHESWKDDDVHELLRGRGMALVCADTDDTEEDEPIVETGSWGYLRLRRPGYDETDLIRWADRVKGTSWERAFVFFKHEDEGAGPRMAARFREIFEGSENG
jgi:uncharacterized protein YecE (DUF72 family)